MAGGRRWCLFQGTGSCVGALQASLWAAGEPGPGLAPQPTVLCPLRPRGAAALPCALGGLPGGHTSPLSNLRRITDGLSLPPLMAKLGLAAAGGVATVPVTPASPQAVLWVRLSNSSLYPPPLGLAPWASLCEVPPSQAPACLVAPFLPSTLLSSHPDRWSSAQPGVSVSPGLGPQHPRLAAPPWPAVPLSSGVAWRCCGCTSCHLPSCPPVLPTGAPLSGPSRTQRRQDQAWTHCAQFLCQQRVCPGLGTSCGN